MGSASKAYLLAYNGALALSWCVVSQPCIRVAGGAVGRGAPRRQLGAAAKACEDSH